jgi:predicted Zn finger-like uncharacterized protein
MNVTCGTCQTVFRIDPAKLPAAGVRARCSVCAGVFWVRPLVAAAESAPVAPMAPARVELPPSAQVPEPPVEARRPSPPPAPIDARPKAAPPALSPPAGPPRVVGAVPPAVTAPPSVRQGPAVPPRPAMPGGAASVIPPAMQPPASRPVVPPRALPPRPLPAEPVAPQPPAVAVTASATAVSSAIKKRPVNPFLSQDPSAKARRLARALISDIVVYHPAKRREGLQNGSLKSLFEDEIQKSWEEYVDQVGKDIAESTVFFHEALNEILADGQAVFP